MTRLLRTNRDGFSVAELIVGIAVIAGVATLAYGVAGKIRDQMKPIRDTATLRQIGAVLHLYINEHNGELPPCVTPVPVKSLAHYMGFTNKAKDWSNDSQVPANSIFLNGANEKKIRQFFTSAYDPKIDPLNAFASNYSMGMNPTDPPETYTDPALYEQTGFTRYYRDIKRPNEKLYMIPSWFMPQVKNRFSEATTSNPFKTTRNPADKGHFPALFADGHVAMVNPAPEGMTLDQINHRWIRPKHP